MHSDRNEQQQSITLLPSFLGSVRDNLRNRIDNTIVPLGINFDNIHVGFNLPITLMSILDDDELMKFFIDNTAHNINDPVTVSRILSDDFQVVLLTHPPVSGSRDLINISVIFSNITQGE